ncbi:MAG: ADP-ribosylglycohydrolase family protein [Lentisphaeria bacterium]|nr:ADP-ribosylglycohydrolase family protein [Lentisphaeria bacterium]
MADGKSQIRNIQLDPERLQDAVRGCWLGKNIGGTLGAPFEGQRTLQNVSFYVQKDLNGNPEPNDDLDLQLAWLALLEYYGVYHLTHRRLGEYWISAVIGPWNEYAVCRWNCQNGFYPPLSGSVDNDVWKWSNGAWIRSEIWACLFPGDPDTAIEFAWLDASCDHVGEGVYAEMFTAALESAAFVEKDVPTLIDIALSKIPADSRVARSVRLVCDCFTRGIGWKEAREEIVKDSADLGWFQAPGNVAFTVLGLLYGGGDFGKSICLAVNCGDDTDCTAATAGSVLGILTGAKNIPQEWLTPIGDGILTKTLNRFNLPMPIPKTVSELTYRVMNLQRRLSDNYPRRVSGDMKSQEIASLIWARSPYELKFELGFATLGVEYPEMPLIEPGKSCPVRLHVYSSIDSMPMVKFRWSLPENWHSAKTEFLLSAGSFRCSFVDSEVTPPDDIRDAMSYLTLEVTSDDRFCPIRLTIPFRYRGAVKMPNLSEKNLDPDEVRYCHMILDSCLQRK